jgi:hypothetical protein
MAAEDKRTTPELERALAELEKKREKGTSAIKKAEAEVVELEEAHAAAERRLTLAGIEGAEWGSRRAWKEAERTLHDLGEKVLAAKKALTERQAVLAPMEDEIADLKTRIIEPKIEAARKRAVAFAEKFRKKHRELAEAARQGTALLKGVEEIVPRRVVLRRAINRYLVVEPLDPKLRGLYVGPRAIRGLPEGCFSIEVFRAFKGEKEGRWKILPGQDAHLKPSEIETQYGDPELPPELSALRDLDLGRLLPSPNGGKPDPLDGAELNFSVIERLLTEEEIARAMGNLSEEGS